MLTKIRKQHKLIVVCKKNKMLTLKDNDFLADMDDRLKNKIKNAVNNIDSLPKNGKYSLSFSGGKDSHALLAIYSVYFQSGGQPLDIIILFSDTHLETSSLYLAIEKAKEYSENLNIPFIFAESDKSYWWFQFGLGYPVPNYRARWCTKELKVKPSQKNQRVSLTGRHYGESSQRDEKLKKGCGTNDCGIDKITKSYDPIIHFTNCEVWDLLFFCDGKYIYEGCFNLLQSNYKKAEDNKTGSLRMGCVFCPVVSVNTIKKNYLDGIIPDFVYQIRLILDELKKAQRINNPRTQKSGSIFIEERRFYWQKIMKYKDLLIEHGWITKNDIAEVEKALSEGKYPTTYTLEHIEKEHKRLEKERAAKIDNPFNDLPLFSVLTKIRK